MYITMTVVVITLARIRGLRPVWVSQAFVIVLPGSRGHGGFGALGL